MIKNILIIVFTIALTYTCNAQSTEPSKKYDYVCPPCNSKCDSLEFKNGGICKHCGMELILKKDLMKLPTDSNKKRIAFYLQDGVEILDFGGPLEVFSAAGHQVIIVSKTTEPITSQGVLKIIPDYDIENVPEVDVLAFFGGNVSRDSMDEDIIKWIQSLTNLDNYFSVCTGAFFLGEAGILKNKTATTFHSALDHLEEKYKDTKVLRDARYVDNGEVITTAGISAGIDGALHLVAKWQGYNKAREVVFVMEYDKWMPGEGILLAEDNPYQNLITLKKLQDYDGIYVNKKGKRVAIKLNEKEKGLYAVIEKNKIPLFHENDDTFSRMNKASVTFIRNKNNEVISIKSSEHPEKFVKQ